MILDILNKKSSNNIIELFLQMPWKELQTSEIIKSSKLTKMSVLARLKEFEKFELILKTTSGRTNIFGLNRSNPTVKHLQILYNIDYLKNKIGYMKDCKIFVYGSFARGENIDNSDIDIIVIGKDRNIIKKLKSIDDRVKVSFYTPIEWSMASRNDKAFFENVEKDKIELV